jgi:predicted GIY-YIG superfamily endonuclease
VRQIWTKQLCAIEAAKYTSTVEFARGNRPAYRATIRYGWFDEICSHMTRARTPSRMITKEVCANEALKHASRVAFQKDGKRLYIAARRRGWLDEISSHMDYLRNPSNELTFERCAEEAQKYSSRTEFARGSTGYYIKARRMGWLAEICGHMEYLSQPWTRAMCTTAAATNASRGDFFHKNPKAYKAALTNGWLEDVCAHMTFLRKPDGYWTKERCAEVASQYSVRKQFQVSEKGCYLYALRRGWLTEICSHMERQGSKFDRYIYIIFSRETRRAYVGLTYKKQVRMANHAKRGRSVVRALLDSPHKIVWSPLMNKDDAAILEDDVIQRLREKGFEVVNARKGGTLGGDTLLWTLDACCAEALAYSSRSAFMRGSKGAYASARKNGWLQLICAHMKPLKRPNGTWNKERCAEEAKKFLSRAEFERGCPGAYNASLNGGWIDEVCLHMKPLRISWTKEMCAAVALKYETRGQFASLDGPAYQAAWKNGWLDQVCSHMRPVRA